LLTKRPLKMVGELEHHAYEYDSVDFGKTYCMTTAPRPVSRGIIFHHSKIENSNSECAALFSRRHKQEGSNPPHITRWRYAKQT
jgi:hypothetical protein